MGNENSSRAEVGRGLYSESFCTGFSVFSYCGCGFASIPNRCTEGLGSLDAVHTIHPLRGVHVRGVRGRIRVLEHSAGGMHTPWLHLVLLFRCLRS